MKVLSAEDRPLRLPLRQLRRSVRAGRPISWPNFRRLALRCGCGSDAIRLLRAYHANLSGG